MVPPPAGPARPRPRYRTGDATADAALAEVVDALGRPTDADLLFESLVSIVRMGREGADRADLKLVTAALKELRYASLVFGPYRDVRKVSIFGSARTEVDDPTYVLARDFGAAMADASWMVITGAGPGIMAAGIEGAGADMAFGVNILLPFESTATEAILGDPKLINFRYFFTRKLTFLRESDAFALFPGGFGTMDEAFELLTLLQTGRAQLAPVVLVESPKSSYWKSWRQFVLDELARRQLISPEDLGLVKICDSVDEATEEVTTFYSSYHSQRTVGRRLVLRLTREVGDAELARLNRDFADIVVSGAIERTAATPSEVDDGDVVDLPRLALRFDRAHFARLRQLVDALNTPHP